ncbi:hypothetical protein ACFQ1L_38300 [Phytohabitans flavus]|uniref:DUF7144 family membrane protein n=1 Tax=Phytohabitans flavus TaxID=1076124 RepID=UPI00363048CA
MATTSAARGTWAVGGLVFAATMMILLGIWEIFVGIAAIVNDNFFVVGPNYTYNLNTTAWGWAHLVLGALVVLAGFSSSPGPPGPGRSASPWPRSWRSTTSSSCRTTRSGRW